AAIAPLLARARRPLVVCGPLDDKDPELPERLGELARPIGAPVLAEAASNLRCPALGDVLVDGHDALLRVPAFRRQHVPDLVVRLGMLPTSKSLSGWLGGRPDVPQVVLQGDGAWSDPSGVVAVVAAGAPSAILGALGDAVPRCRPDPSWLTRWRRSGVAARRAVGGVLGDTGGAVEGR